MIRQCPDLNFLILTKRIDRFQVGLPADWGAGYENVTIGCSIENQKVADYRLPYLKQVAIKQRMIICQPLLGPIDLSAHLDSEITQVVVGGESGLEARPCHYDWILAIRQLCIEWQVSFEFRQTGARFVKDGRLYRIKKTLQSSQARKANINVTYLRS